MSISETFTRYYIDENNALHCTRAGEHQIKIISYADAKRLRTLPDVLPERLNHLSINFAERVTKLPDELPAGLEYLHLIGTGVSVLPPLPAGLKVLGISGSKITELPDVLPDGLSDLGISMIKEIHHVNLPEHILSFVASGSGLEGNFDVRPSLIGLDLSYTEVDQLTGLEAASHMIRLDISHTGITALPESIRAISTLRYINVSFTGISLLPELSVGLMQLDVRSTEIPSEDIDALAAARPELIIIR